MIQEFINRIKQIKTDCDFTDVQFKNTGLYSTIFYKIHVIILQSIQKFKKQLMDMEQQLIFDGQFFLMEKESEFCQRQSGNFSEDQPLWEQQLVGNSREEYDCLEIISEQLKNTVNIKDTPMNEIMEIVADNFILSAQNKLQLRKKLRKMKLDAKRRHSKNRLKSQIQHCSRIILAPISKMDDEEQAKKQKNRLSAQISRDRKKEYSKKLESQNQQLLTQKLKVQEQNKRLKEQIDNRKNMMQNVQKKNSFLSLIILLGIIFLMRIIGMAPQRINRNKVAQDTVNLEEIMMTSEELIMIEKKAQDNGVVLPSGCLNLQWGYGKRPKITQNLANNIIALKRQYLY